jgi:hypothetical protein
MNFNRWIRQLIPLTLVFILFLSACASAPSKYDKVQKDTTGFGSPAAVDKQAEKGAKFNEFFPGGQGSYEVVPAQEKKGFAEYKLKKDGNVVAMLSISDTLSVPEAAAKYAEATDKIGGYPAVQQGTTATGVLVGGRYQVKVLSRDPSFTAEDRAAWIQKFDLKGLSQLAVESKGSRRAAKKLAPLVNPDQPAATKTRVNPAPKAATPAPRATAPAPQPAAASAFRLPRVSLQPAS